VEKVRKKQVEKPLQRGQFWVSKATSWLFSEKTSLLKEKQINNKTLIL
jgi:hypothetical protein